MSLVSCLWKLFDQCVLPPSPLVSVDQCVLPPLPLVSVVHWLSVQSLPVEQLESDEWGIRVSSLPGHTRVALLPGCVAARPAMKAVEYSIIGC